MGICARREEFFWAALKATQLQRIQEVALRAEPSALDFSPTSFVLSRAHFVSTEKSPFPRQAFFIKIKSSI
jgi:hypothetical protein